MRAPNHLNMLATMLSMAADRVLDYRVVIALASLMLATLGLSQEGDVATTRAAATTMANRTVLALDVRYDAARSELTVGLSNTGQSPVKIDQDLIFGMEISARMQDGSAVVWEELPSSAQDKPLSPRITELPPGKTIRRVVALRDGFDYFEASRGSVRKGNVSVDVTTAHFGHRRLPAHASMPRQISIAFDGRSRLLRDGFAYCTGTTPESLGLELGPAEPVVVDLDKGTSNSKAGQ